jgi:hypothetical protein
MYTAGVHVLCKDFGQGSEECTVTSIPPPFPPRKKSTRAARVRILLRAQDGRCQQLWIHGRRDIGESSLVAGSLARAINLPLKVVNATMSKIGSNSRLARNHENPTCFFSFFLRECIFPPGLMIRGRSQVAATITLVDNVASV